MGFPDEFWVKKEPKKFDIGGGVDAMAVKKEERVWMGFVGSCEVDEGGFRRGER